MSTCTKISGKLCFCHWRFHYCFPGDLLIYGGVIIIIRVNDSLNKATLGIEKNNYKKNMHAPSNSNPV